MSEVGDFDPFIRPRIGEIAAAREEAARRGGEDISFGDFIDLINPLHHLPVIGPLYREITGDEIKPAAQILGGFLYGGPVGLVTSVSHAIAEEATGKDVTGHVLAALFGEDDETVAAAPQTTAQTTLQSAPPTTPPTTSEAAAVAASAPQGAALPEIVPAAGTAPEAEPSRKAAAEEIPAPPDGAGTDDTKPAQPAAVLEGDAALRAFLRDREAAFEQAGATAGEADAAEPPAASAADTDRASGDAAPPEAVSAMTPQRFMPVRPEHYNGRMAVRGPSGFGGESTYGAASAITGETGAESPFAARMMEALKKYSALQDAPQASAATLP